MCSKVFIDKTIERLCVQYLSEHYVCVFERHHSRRRAENVCVHPGIMFVPLLTGAAADKYPAESFDSFKGILIVLFHRNQTWVDLCRVSDQFKRDCTVALNLMKPEPRPDTVQITDQFNLFRPCLCQKMYKVSSVSRGSQVTSDGFDRYKECGGV